MSVSDQIRHVRATVSPQRSLLSKDETHDGIRNGVFLNERCKPTQDPSGCHRPQPASWSGSRAWGKGLATEFAIYAIKFGFDVIKLTEISAVVRENHLASQKVLQKSGLRYVKEIHDVKDAPPSLLYSISVDEWLRNLEVNASV